MLSIFGFQLTAANGAQVLVHGLPAPVLSASPTEIDLIVPFGAANGDGTPTNVQLVLPNSSTQVQAPSILNVALITTDGSHAAALNQDGTVNSAANPAKRGSVVSLFGTGLNGWPADKADGALAKAAEPLDQFYSKLEAFDISGVPINVLYLGTAPGLLYGVFQINLQLPLNANTLSGEEIYVMSGSTRSKTVEIYVQ